jgi:hypothetical protein
MLLQLPLQSTRGPAYVNIDYNEPLTEFLIFVSEFSR